ASAEDMEERSSRTVSRTCAALLLCAALAASGCSGLHGWPRALAGIGAVAVAGGSGAWAAGEVKDSTGRDSTSSALISAGFVSVVGGLALIALAGGWIAVSVSCQAYPDC